MLRFMSAGESHGECMVGILEGLPAGLKLDIARINQELARRQQGYGRGGRMKIEKDKIKIVSGIKAKKTIGAPVAFIIKNRDFTIEQLGAVNQPRPGHADLSGIIKYGFSDGRCVLERASARETVLRVAAGALCKTLLKEFNIFVKSKLISVGGQTKVNDIKRKIDAVRKKGDSLGGVFEVQTSRLPIGLGSYVHYDRRLDARLAFALVSIPAVKALEFGMGFAASLKPGSEVHDAIYYSKAKGFFRKTNNAGGIEGGMSNGEPIIIRCAMKPIATLGKPLPSVHIKTKKQMKASVQRSDIAAVAAAGVVAEGMVAMVIADALLEKFGQDDLKKIKMAYRL